MIPYIIVQYLMGFNQQFPFLMTIRYIFYMLNYLSFFLYIINIEGRCFTWDQKNQ